MITVINSLTNHSSPGRLGSLLNSRGQKERRIVKLLFLLSIASIALAVAAAADDAISLDPIYVESEIEKSGTPLVSAPGNFSVRDQEEVRKQVPNNLESALGNEPNLVFLGGPRAQTKLPQIRGLNSDRILILEEGVRQNFQTTHSGRTFSDFSLIENAEVVKGPWSSLYGSGALGGVVSFRRSTALDFIRRTGREKGGEAALEGATNAEEFGQRLTLYGRTGNFSPLISYHRLRASDLTLGNGAGLPYSGIRSDDLYSSLGYAFSEKHSITVKLNSFQDRTTLPLNPNTEESRANFLADFHMKKQDVVGDYRLEGEKFDLHAKSFYRRTLVRKSRLTDHRLDLHEVETYGIDAWNNFTVYTKDNFRSVLTLGAEAFEDQNVGRRNSTPLTSFPDGSTRQFGLYLQPDFLFWGKLKITPVVRHDNYRSKDKNLGVTINKGNKTSFKANASYEYIPKNLFYVSWGEAFSAPRLQDLYNTDMHFPGNFFVPNPGLRPERANTKEIGFKNHFLLTGDHALAGNGTYFETRAEDFVQRQVFATTTQFANLESVRLRGYELSASYQNPYLGVSAAYSQVRSQDRLTREPLEDTSPDQWTGKVEVYPVEELTIGVATRFSEAQTVVPTGGTPTDSFVTEDIYGSWVNKSVGAHLRVNNAWNKTYRQHGAAIFERGRDIRASLSFLF